MAVASRLMHGSAGTPQRGAASRRAAAASRTHQILVVEGRVVELAHGVRGGRDVLEDDPRLAARLLRPHDDDVDDLAEGRESGVEGPLQLALLHLLVDVVDVQLQRARQRGTRIGLACRRVSRAPARPPSTTPRRTVLFGGMSAVVNVAAAGAAAVADVAIVYRRAGSRSTLRPRVAERRRYSSTSGRDQSVVQYYGTAADRVKECTAARLR